MRLDDNEEERERVKAAGGQIGKAMSPGIRAGVTSVAGHPMREQFERYRLRRD